MKKLHPILIVALASILWLSACATKKQVTGSTSGGTPDGSTYEKAIVINEQHERQGIRAEYAWIDAHYPGYKSRGQGVA